MPGCVPISSTAIPAAQLFEGLHDIKIKHSLPSLPACPKTEVGGRNRCFLITACLCRAERQGSSSPPQLPEPGTSMAGSFLQQLRVEAMGLLYPSGPTSLPRPDIKPLVS